MTATIYAPATAPGRAAVAVLRISGPATAAAIISISGALPSPRRASLRRLRTSSGEVLDQALVLWMPGPSSFTGEDCAELHLHGGAAVVSGVVEALAALGLRLAEPGAFTRRAFENGRIDLVEAEGVADLIDAETKAQRHQAMEQLQGGVSGRHGAWREALLDILAHLEAAIDFADEDLPEDVAARARAPMLRLREELADATRDRRGERLREGLRIALVGAPNAGKSSLLNALLERDAAIVAATPGTTRDVVEGRLILAGVPAVIADTAGLRSTDDAVEGEGVRRAEAWAETADLRIWVVDGNIASPAPLPALLVSDGDLVVLNKADLPQRTLADHRFASVDCQVLKASALSGDVGVVRGWLSEWAAKAATGHETPASTRERHRLLLEEAALRLDAALGSDQPELIAEDVRLAVRAMERLSGRIDAEEVLGRVFSTFCIGK